MKRINNINCCVSGCHNKKGRDHHLSFHRFPLPKANNVVVINKFGFEEKICRRKAWERVLLLKKAATTFNRVCSLHFRRDDFILPDYQTKHPRLKKNAVPSQKIPKGSTVVKHNIEFVSTPYYPGCNYEFETEVSDELEDVKFNVEDLEDVKFNVEDVKFTVEDMKFNVEDVKFKLDDLHHSIDIKEEVDTEN